DPPVLVRDRQVTGVEPAATKGLGGLLLVAPVARSDLRAAVDDLADLPDRYLATVVVDEPGLDVEHGPARGPGMGELLVRREDRRDRRELGLTVEVPQ